MTSATRILKSTPILTLYARYNRALTLSEFVFARCFKKARRPVDYCTQQHAEEGVPNQHNSIIFCVFVLMQLFNQLNARKLHGEVILYTHTHTHTHTHAHAHAHAHAARRGEWPGRHHEDHHHVFSSSETLNPEPCKASWTTYILYIIIIIVIIQYNT
jgi:hypothetical protein